MKDKTSKVSIIGAGFVGATTAYTLMTSELISELVIVDVNKDKAIGEAMDMSHGLAFVKPIEIRGGSYEDTKDSDIVIITAGIGRKPGESRTDLISKNLGIFKTIVPEIVKYSPNCIILVVSNPMDILSYITYKLSGFPSERVIGSGTVLDTSRLKYMLSNHFSVDARNVHAYIMGEHGDSEIATWSLANIAGVNLDDFCMKTCNKCDGNFKYKMYEEVKNAGKEVIERKGATYYAIALAIKRIAEAILRDEDSILTVSSLLKGQYGIENIYMGVPAVVGRTGVKQILEVPLNHQELEDLKASADKLRSYVSDFDI